MALQFARGIEKKENSSTSSKKIECPRRCACSSGTGMKLHFNCSVTDCATKSSQ